MSGTGGGGVLLLGVYDPEGVGGKMQDLMRCCFRRVEKSYY